MTPEEIRAGQGSGGEAADMNLADAEVHAPAKKSPEHSMPLGDVRVGAPVGANGSAAYRVPRRDLLPDAEVATEIVRANLGALSEALEADAGGATGLDEASRRDLAEGVRRVLRGETDLDPDLAGRLLGLLEPLVGGRARSAEPAGGSPVEPPEEPLTAREVEVLKLIAGSRSNREIAEELVVSAGTVRVHVQHIIAKLGVSDRTGAVVRGIELGLIPLPTANQAPSRSPND